MTLDEAVAALIENAEEWRSGRDAEQAVGVVRAACDVLVAGYDGLAMATLAGVEFSDAKDKVPDFVAGALAEVGVPFFLPGSDLEQTVWLTSMAALQVSGALCPRALAAAAGRAIGSEGNEASQRLVDLAFKYVLADQGDPDALAPAAIDAAVISEARRLSELN
jgi:hypothetical protein